MQDLLDFEDRLKFVIKKSGGARIVAETIGVTTSAVGAMTRGGGVHALRLAGFIKKLGYNPTWVMFGDGEMEYPRTNYRTSEEDELLVAAEPTHYAIKSKNEADPFKTLSQLFTTMEAKINEMMVEMSRQAALIEDIEQRIKH